MHRKISGFRIFLIFLSVLLSGFISSALAETYELEPVGQVGGATNAVDTQGNYAYAGEGPRLTVIDISDPLGINLVATSGLLPDVVQDVAVSGSYAYIADRIGGLRVFDIATPGNLHEVGSFCPPGFDSRGVAVVGSLAYVAGTGGLSIVDVSDPTAPTLAGSLSYVNPSGRLTALQKIVVEGQYAYVTAGRSGMVVIDVADPANPVKVAEYNATKMPWDSASWVARGISLSGPYAFVAVNTGVLMLDISNPAQPSYVSYQPLVWNGPVPFPTSMSWAQNVLVQDGFAYVTIGGGHYTGGTWNGAPPNTNGLWVVDVRTPAQPVILGAYSPRGSANDVRVVGAYAFVAMGSSLKVVNIPNLLRQPNDPNRWYMQIPPGEPGSPGVGIYAPPTGMLDSIVLSGNYLYGGMNNMGLRAIDVSDPTAPRWTGSYDVPWSGGYDNYRNLAVNGTRLYAPHDRQGLEIFDISDPRSLVRISSYASPSGAAWGVALSGNHAYVADGGNGLVVLDVSAPENPVKVGSVDTPGFAYAVDISWPYVYIADGGSGLQIIDISEVTTPRIVGTVDTPGMANHVKLSGSYAYVADGPAGLRIIDITNPAAPSPAGSFDTAGDAQRVSVSGQHAYVADAAGGLLVLDVSNPSQPAQAVVDSSGGVSDSVAASGDYIFTSRGAGGLQILRLNINHPPIAHAGGEQTVDEGTRVTLDGSASRDPDGNPVSFSWHQLSGAPVALSGFESASPAFMAPEVGPAGDTLIFALTVNDGIENSLISVVRVTIRNVNHPPVANAGGHQTVDEGIRVLLDGSASGDPDGNALTFSWAQLVGASVTLDLADPLHPAFIAPWVKAGGETLTFQLIVSDGLVTSIDTVDVTVKNINHAPVADAGDNQTVNETALVTLSGMHSYDVDDEPLTCSWRQVAGTPVEISGSGTANPSFTAPEVGLAGDTLVFALTVNDGIEDSPVSVVSVTIENVNHPPVANAGGDQTKNEGSVVTLDGAETRDPDGDTVTFAWRQVSGPPVMLSDPSRPTPHFTAPFVGSGGAILVFELVAADEFGAAATDEVTVTVPNFNDPPRCDLAQPSAASLWPPNHKLLPVRIVGTTDSDDGRFTITVTGVTQDEPTDGLGDGDTNPDAVILNQESHVLLRAERAGTGNGRVYQVNFTAMDSFGESCSGAVTVWVPHERKDASVDDGHVYDSTQP